MKKKSFGAKVAHWFGLNRFLMVGLDVTPKHIPKDFKPELSEEERLTEFIFLIVDLTADYCLGWKPNAKFYLGSKRAKRLEKVCDYINTVYPDHVLLIDGKDGDIGNTNTEAVSYYTEELKVDAITLAPFMGYKNSMDEFLKNGAVGCFLLCLTSNEGSKDFLKTKTDGQLMYEKIAEFADSATWNANKNLHLVVGATNTVDEVENIRRFAGEEAIFLMPGFGAQGGSPEVIAAARNKAGTGIFGVVARDIIAPSPQEGEGYKEAIVRQAKMYSEMFAAVPA